MKKNHSNFWGKSKEIVIESPDNSPIPIDQFIFQSIKSGYNTILIGEQHNSLQTGIETLNQIAKKLQQYARINDIKIAVFVEGLQTTDESQLTALPIEALNSECMELYKQGIPIYGLENTKTDPNILLENASFQEINDFLKENGLFKSFIFHYYKSHFLEEPTGSLEETEERVLEIAEYFSYQMLAMNAFGNSDQRIILPNQTFSSYIKSMPKETICIAVVGAKHIPTASRNQRIIDFGMQKILEQSRKTISTFITGDLEENQAPYQPNNDDDVEYTAINSVTYLPLYSLINDEIDEQRESLVSQNATQSQTDVKIILLEQLKKTLTENDSPTPFSKILTDLITETKSHDLVSNLSTFIVNVLSKNKNALFGSHQKSNSTHTFLENLQEKYGHYTMHEIQKTRQDIENITNENTSMMGLD